MQSYRLTSKEIREINENLNIKISRLDKIIEQAGKLMSTLTSMMSVSMTPKSSDMSVSIAKIDIVYFDFNNFLLIIITSVNIVKTKHIYSKTDISRDVLEHLKKVLNGSLVNIDINTVSLPLILNMETMMGDYASIISPILKVIYEAISEINEAQIYIDGAANLLNMPEYHDVARAKSLINLMDNKESLLNIFSQSAENKLNIYIGEENSITSGGDSSFVFKTFSLGDKILGAIGVIGPKRMDYSKIIAKLEYFSGNMADIIKNELDEKSNSYTAIDDSKFMQGGKSGNG